MPIPIHFWNKTNGNVYDPSLVVTKEGYPDMAVDYHEERCIFTNVGDEFIEAGFFFSLAPEEIIK